MPSTERPTSFDDCPAKPAGGFRALHTADWHLGKTLADQPRDEEHGMFLDFLLQAVRELQVDAIIVAGDVFDTANPPQRAQTQYYDFIAELSQTTACSLVITAGNHDSPSQLEAPRLLLRALRSAVIGAMPEAVEEAIFVLPSPEDPQLVVAAIPFLRDRDLRAGQAGQTQADIAKALRDGIARTYAEAADATASWRSKGAAVMATGHLTATDAAVSDSERDIHVGGLGAVGPDAFGTRFDYVALGHFHRPQSVGEVETIRYSGSPFPLSFSEAVDHKEVRLLDFANGGLSNQVKLPVPVARKLVCLRARRSELEAVIQAFEPGNHALPCWVEVVVTDALSGDDLQQQVQSLVAGKPFEVLKVTRERQAATGGAWDREALDGQSVDAILDDPTAVFERRLEVETGLEEAEIEALRVAYQELLSMYAEAEREGDAT